jgi:hypothetical protein
MNTWINEIVQLTNMGRMSLDWSDARYLLPDTKTSVILLFIIMAWIVCAWEDRWLNDRNDQRSTPARPSTGTTVLKP